MIILEMSVSASVLILAIAGLRALAIHKLPKVTFLVLWGVTICRLLIPFSVLSPFRTNAFSNNLNTIFTGQHIQSVASFQPVAPLQQIIRSTGQAAAAMLANPILIAWGLGAIVCGIFFLVTHFRSRREYQTALVLDNRFVSGWLRSHKTRRPVQIRQFDRINAPLTYGILRPVILLPKRMDWTDEKQLEYVLTHEFTHIRRFDTAWKWMLAVTLCIHWFNPLVWGLYFLANRDIEISCDESVVRLQGVAQKSAYARALIQLEERRNIYNLLGNNFSKNAIKERINAIMKLKKVSLLWMAAAVLLVVAAFIVFATTGPIRIFQSMPGSSHAMAATPVQQSLANIAGITKLGNGNSVAMPVLEHPVDITALYGQAKSISDAKNLIKSTSPKDQSKASSYSSIVIKFTQDMDASTLNGDNIIVVDEKHSTIVTYAFNFNYHADTRELHLDLKPDMKPTWKRPSSLGIGTGNTVFVFLTDKIKTADGKFIDNDYIFSYRT